MSSLNRAVKNCLPTIPKEYKAYPVFTPYARLWSVKLWPSLVSDTTIKAISLRPALRAKARGHTRSNTNSALTKQPQYSSPTWLGLEETLTICTHARDTKIDCARTSSRSALNMPTGTGCYSRGLGGKNKMQLILWWKSRNVRLRNEITCVLTNTFRCPGISWGSREWCEAE